MKSFAFKRLSIAAAAILAIGNAMAASNIVITEVDPAGSGTGSGSYNNDWFELTNTGTTAQDITGWSMLDNHAASNTTSPYSGTISIGNSSGSVLLTGITSIAAGQTVVFLDATGVSSTSAEIAKFEAAWFGANLPANFTIGTYATGSGQSAVGLSTSTDMVNIFSGSATNSALVASVAFGADTGAGTFDNTAGLNNATLTTKSVVGVNGAFASATGGEIGSPGVVASVPEADGFALAFVGFGALVAMRRGKKSAPKTQG